MAAECHQERLHQLIECISALNVRAMPAPCKHLQAALGSAPGLLRVSDRNDRIGLSPDNQHRNIQPFQYITQVDALLSIREGGIGGRGQRFLRTRLQALLVKLLHQRLLNQARIGEEAREFGAKVLRSWPGTYQFDDRAIDFWPQSSAVDQDKPLDPPWMASGEGKGYCTTERVANDAHAPPIQGIEEARQQPGLRWHAVIDGRFSAIARSDEIKRADTEARGEGRQV